MNNTIKHTVLAAIAAGAILLSGCAVSTEAPTQTDAKPAPAATQVAETPKADEPAGPAAKPTVEEVVKLEAGTELTDEQADAIKRDLKNGVRAYKLPTGKKILVKKDKPLPKEVVKAEAKKVAAVDMPTGGSMSDQMESISKMDAAASSAAYATGKRVCVVMQAMYGNIDGPGASLQWVGIGCPLGSNGLVPNGKDKATIVSAAKALIAAQDNPDEWALIVED